jgi:hypothetical protein
MVGEIEENKQGKALALAAGVGEADSRTEYGATL